MGLANWLTVLRILLIPVFITLLVYRLPGWALLTFALAAFTDLLDGWVARRYAATRFGSFLVPLAAKLLLTASFVTLTDLRALPFWIAAVVISRDVILIVGALLVHIIGIRIDPRPTRAGKGATFLQVVTVLLGLLSRYVSLEPALMVTMCLTADFAIYSGGQYLVQGMRFLSSAERDDHEASLRH